MEDGGEGEGEMAKIGMEGSREATRTKEEKENAPLAPRGQQSAPNAFHCLEVLLWWETRRGSGGPEVSANLAFLQKRRKQNSPRAVRLLIPSSSRSQLQFSSSWLSSGRYRLRNCGRRSSGEG